MVEFRVFGFNVQLQTGFLFLVGIVVLFGLRNQEPIWYMAATIGVFLFSILVHELGHAFVSRWLGVEVMDIVIHGFGGHVTHARCTVKQSLGISLAGPFFGLGLGAISVALYSVVQNPYAEAALEISMFVNIFWSLFNLLPIFPLDGGHAMLNGLQLVMKPTPAAKLTFGVGLVLGLVVALAGFQAGLIFVAFFAGSFAYQNFQLLNSMRQRVLDGGLEG